ncbi:unnamed protein product [Bursaphelenchus okinawaensis]|uniref:Nudix hydrolase domain-containing protein n=1 Tax=Bursaphelenchus okinawaensis TaxID=465554 RepID=A0A811K3C3_9BILA|nr:unnamed protein product [Bursaphelenchus okinawaensis]CAG9091335.1 unnamed protein product [Bursaphelenchus okinawaensis]
MKPPKEIPWKSFEGLLSRPNAQQEFQDRTSQLQKLSKAAESGEPRKADENKDSMIRKVSSMANRIAWGKELKFKKGDSAVLVPLLERKNQPHLLFTQRSFQLRAHRGEICFPGGRMDQGESPEETALREAEEEVGLQPSDVTLWGRLPAMFTRQLTFVQPVVGLIDETTALKLYPQTDEVQTVFLTPLAELVLSTSYTGFRVGKNVFHMPLYYTEHYEVISKTANAVESHDHRQKIWGLSAGITTEALAVLSPEPWSDNFVKVEKHKPLDA